MRATTPTRRRNAAATREAILISARRAFARAGYDGAGVREIAAGAGVTAMLVNRYFGSKERLFAEVVAQTMTKPTILTPEVLNSSTRSEDIAAALIDVTKADATPLDGFLIMLHSASSKQAAQIGRDQIENHYQRVLTASLAGDWAAQRAALVLSLVAGIQVMRQMIGLRALADTEPAVLIKILAPAIQQIIEGDQQSSDR